MKITTWNVNGLRAALGKNVLDWVGQYEADVLCLQEVRARPEQLEEQGSQALSGLFPHSTWNPATRPGYSGVATFSRGGPLESWLGLDDDRFDDEGRVIVSRFPSFLLYNIYFPNGGQDNGRVPYKLDFYAHLLDICDGLHARGESVVICGDFNTSHRPIDLKNPRQNEDNTGFLPEERALDRPLPGARFRRHLPPALPGAGAVHLVDLPHERPRPQRRLAPGLFLDFTTTGPIRSGCGHP